MPKLLFVALWVVTGTAVGAVAMDWLGDRSADDVVIAAPSSFDRSAPVAERVAALEEALSVERQARQLLQEEVFFLHQTLEGLQVSGENAAIPPPILDSNPGDENSSSEERRSSRAERRAERRKERLLASGFTQTEVDWILRRESELQMEALQSRYAARRAGESVRGVGRGAAQSVLREELGDERYANYLEASGRPTRVAISSVFEGSPALTAGLRPGDEIVSYDGQRVFGMDEITGLTLTGQVGEPVPVDIMRDGVLMQVSMPRGPLGVVGGRRYRR